MSPAGARASREPEAALGGRRGGPEPVGRGGPPYVSADPVQLTVHCLVSRMYVLLDFFFLIKWKTGLM